MGLSKHNHMTRDIKPRGVCEGCDEYHDGQICPCRCHTMRGFKHFTACCNRFDGDRRPPL